MLTSKTSPETMKLCSHYLSQSNMWLITRTTPQKVMNSKTYDSITFVPQHDPQLTYRYLHVSEGLQEN